MAFAPKVLTDDALKSLGLSSSDVVEAISKTILDKAAGRLHVTPKSVIQPGDGRYMMTTLSTGQDPDLIVVKAVTVCPENPSRGLPSITGAIMVMNAQTGECLALMDAEWITSVRTAGLSAVAARPLANPNSEVMSFVGCGVQARSHLELFAGLYPLKSIRAFGRGRANIDRLCDMARDLGVQAEIAPTPEAALDNADLVVTSIPVTFDGTPYLDAGLMKPGAMAIITDACKPWVSEGLNAFETIVVDDRAQEESMPQPMVPPARINADLAELLDKGIDLAEGPRAFMFRGIAAGDYALAARLWQELEQHSGSGK